MSPSRFSRLVSLTRSAHLLVLGASLLFGACDREGTSGLAGVRLGMSPRDVRERFAGGEGAWQTQVGGGLGASDDTVLAWTASSSTRRVRFEFHLGMLVAIRAHTSEATTSERVDLTPKTVTVHTPASNGTDIVVLARDCPTHHEEAESLAARAR